MIEDRLANICRRGGGAEKPIDGRLEGRHLRHEARGGAQVVVEPSFESVELVCEVDGSGTEGGRVEGRFLERNGDERERSRGGE